MAGSHSFQTEGVSRLRQSIKGEGTVESYCWLPTNEGEGRGGRVIWILQSLLKGSGKFYPETTKILWHPLPPQAITKDHSFNRHSSMIKRSRSKRLFEWNLLQNRTPWCNCQKKKAKSLKRSRWGRSKRTKGAWDHLSRALSCLIRALSRDLNCIILADFPLILFSSRKDKVFFYFFRTFKCLWPHPCIFSGCFNSRGNRVLSLRCRVAVLNSWIFSVSFTFI